MPAPTPSEISLPVGTAPVTAFFDQLSHEEGDNIVFFVNSMLARLTYNEGYYNLDVFNDCDELHGTIYDIFVNDDVATVHNTHSCEEEAREEGWLQGLAEDLGQFFGFDSGNVSFVNNINWLDATCVFDV